jgi:predicted RNase H-like nuclease
VVLGDALGPADRVPVDDVLDAAVAAWTARRVALGTARSLPSPPEDVGDGWPTAIWV